MKEKVKIRNGATITEVRSDGGKLLFVKTKEGYEMKCPRTKAICLVKYEDILKDCCQCLNFPDGQEVLKLIKNNNRSHK